MAKKVTFTKPVDGSSVRQKAYHFIQGKIISGELRAGQTISELSLAKDLHISRTPVREALNQLVAEGLLEQDPNRRPVVVMLNRQDIIELYELREALEVYAVGKVARHALRPSDIERLQSMCDAVWMLKEELDESGKPELNGTQMERFMADDLHFHTLLIRAAGNARIWKLINETRLLMRIFSMRRQGHTSKLLANIHRQHSEVLRAVTNHDETLAMRQISEHIRTSLEERLEDYDHWEIEASLRESTALSSNAGILPK